MQSDIQQLIYGVAKLAPDSAVTSQQAEHYGVIGILILCLAIQVSSPFVLSSSIPVWIDNEQTQS